MVKSKADQNKEIAKGEQELVQYSAKVAANFIHDNVLPLLEDFEFNNDNEEYLSGFATHSLFAMLVQRLGEMGYTEKELRKEIKTYLNMSVGHTIH